MSTAEIKIVESYSDLFEGLSARTKVELIERLSKSLKANEESKDFSFYASFGSFPDDKSAEEIISDIKSVRNF